MLGISAWPRGLYVPGRCSRPLLFAGRRLSAGAALAGLLLLSALVPASAQTLTWKIVPSPNVGLGVNSNYFEGVSCTSATACMAVGYFDNSSDIAKNLTASWDGTSWTGVPSPSPGPADNNFLQGVSCASAAACTAVGYSLVSGSKDKTLIESWDGTSWTVVHAPNPANFGGNFLIGVSCVSAAACTTVGYSLISGSVYRTLIESWDGTSWTDVPSPIRSIYDSVVGSISCVSATACTAVGDSDFRGRPSRTLIESGTASS
jgi:hypothetical protein